MIDGLEVNNLLHYTALPPGRRNRDLYLKIIHQRLDKLHAAGVPLHVQDARDYDALSRVLGEIEPAGGRPPGRDRARREARTRTR